MSMEQNQLTRDLYAAGYTREDHPSFVYWSDWQNFGYLFEALLKFTWETPCGLLVDGKSDLGRGLACSDASFQGIDYCPENDNPLLRCPYERKDCPHSISGFPVPLCPCHTTGKRYSFEQSAEKVETERSERQHRQYMEITGGVYCACVVCGSVWTAAASRRSTLTPQRKAGTMLPARTAPRRYGCGSLRRFIRCIDLLSIHFKGRMPVFGVLSLLAHKDVI